VKTTGVVCYIRDRGRVLLQLKAEDRFGGGFWNGPGGKVLDGEPLAGAAAREVREETGLTIRDLFDHGSLTFVFGDDAEPAFSIQVFSTGSYGGELCANDEGPLEWFPEDALPYDRMWPDDVIWLPHLLAGRRFEGTFRLSADHQRLLEHDLRVEE
jgi:8-oxo-dGTP pyrophosphatase MutT (NUDIX family)